MAQLNTLVFQQAFTSTNTVTVTHNANNNFLNAKVVIGGDYRTDLIESISTTNENELIVLLKSAQTGIVQIFNPDLLLATASGANSPSTSNNYCYAYDDTTQDLGSVRATGTVTLTGGASGSVNGITVDGVQIMSGAVSFNTDLTITAALVAKNISDYVSSPNYSAKSVGIVITIYSVLQGTAANGRVVVASSTTITTAKTNMAGGTAPTTNVFSNINFSSSIQDGWVHNKFTPSFICNRASQYIATLGFNCEKSGSGSPEVSMIVTKNGTRIVGSHQGMDITSNNTSFALSRTFIFDAIIGDEILVRGATSNNSVQLVPAPDPTSTVVRVCASLTIARLT